MFGGRRGLGIPSGIRIPLMLGRATFIRGVIYEATRQVSLFVHARVGGRSSSENWYPVLYRAELPSHGHPRHALATGQQTDMH